MGFQTEASKDSLCPRWAAQLAQALRTKNLLTRNPNLAHWSAQLTQLLRAGMLAARIQHVLDWYCQHAGEPYLPQAYSAESFRAKFEQIETALSKTLAGHAAPIITPLAQRAADRLADKLRWPSEIVTELAAIVQISQDRLAHFITRLQVFTPSIERHRLFIRRVLDMHLWIHWIEECWMPLVHDFYCRRSSFVGDPRSLMFDPRSLRFLASFWRAWASDYAGQWNAGIFDSLLQDLLTETPQEASGSLTA